MKPPRSQKSPTSQHGLTARHVREAAGLSYRQLNGWDSKGAISGNRDNDSGWRKFSLRELFAIMVCAEIRSRFSVPLESLGYIQSFMLKPNADHFRYAVETMGSVGATLYLQTDLQTTFQITTDVDFGDRFQDGLFGGDAPAAFIFLKLNPIVNRLLSCLDTPIELKATDRLRRFVRDARLKTAARNHEETEVLRLIRSKDYQRVVIHLADGNIISADTEQELSKASPVDLEALLATHDYQTITVTKHNGTVVRALRKTPIKFPKHRKTRPADTEKP